MTRKSITIAGREIGPDSPPYIVAELSANHNGDINRAFAIMEAARDAGAHAVKLQTYTADTITIDHDGPGFVIEGGLWDGRRLHELYQEASTPWDWHRALFDKGRELGIAVFSSPFDETAIELLESLQAPAYKIASFELVDLPLIRQAAMTGKPLVMSTGMANLAEIGDAVSAAREAGCDQLILLHCVSSYPAPADQSNLRTIADLTMRFDVITGLSDHTLGTSVSIAATALGAPFIEKHFTLRRSDGGPDSAFSLEPAELEQLVEGTLTAWQALGRVNYDRTESERGNVQFRRSLYAVADIREGELLTARNTRSIRPGFGLPPKHFPEILGKRATRDIPRGTPLAFSMIAGGNGA